MTNLQYFQVVIFVSLSLLFVGCHQGGTTEEAVTPNITAAEGYTFKQLLYHNSCESNAPNHIQGISHSGKKSLKLTTAVKYSPGCKVTAKEAGMKPNDELRISIWMFKEAMFNNLDEVGLIVLSQERGGQNIIWESLDITKEVNDKDINILGEWQEFNYYRVIEDLQPNDLINIYAWNNKGEPFYLDDFKVELWQKADSATPKVHAPDSYQKVADIHKNTFEDTNVPYTIVDPTNEKNHIYQVSIDQQYSPALKSTLGDLNVQAGDYLKLIVKSYMSSDYFGTNSNTYLTLSIDGATEEDKVWHSIPVEPQLQNNRTWTEITHWVQIPSTAKPSQNLSAYLWRPAKSNGKDLYIDDFQLELWRQVGN
ncbi:MAG: hypothetical protein GY810_27395 [Aureispira sp.]|nr:hypothetical protein [Aureispira sp.]